MKIVHILANNLDIWQNAVIGTSCLVNAYVDISELINSLPQYNARDVVGFIFFPTSLTPKLLKNLKLIDGFFKYLKTTAIIIGDNADKFLETHYIPLPNIDLYMLNSENGSISDTDINNIFTLLLAAYGDIYKIPNPLQKLDNLILNDTVTIGDEAEFALKIALGDDLYGIEKKEK